MSTRTLSGIVALAPPQAVNIAMTTATRAQLGRRNAEMLRWIRGVTELLETTVLLPRNLSLLNIPGKEENDCW